MQLQLYRFTPGGRSFLQWAPPPVRLPAVSHSFPPCAGAFLPAFSFLPVLSGASRIDSLVSAICAPFKRIPLIVRRPGALPSGPLPPLPAPGRRVRVPETRAYPSATVTCSHEPAPDGDRELHRVPDRAKARASCPLRGEHCGCGFDHSADFDQFVEDARAKPLHDPEDPTAATFKLYESYG